MALVAFAASLLLAGFPFIANLHGSRWQIIATMAAVAFAGLLVVIMRSDEVRGILTDLVRRALTVS